MSGTVELSVRGETLILHPDRALLWPRQSTAVVADTHFGKSGVFGWHGVAVPAGSDDADRARLSRLISAHAIRRLIVLGDFLHAPIDAASPDAEAMQQWSSSFDGVRIQVVAGNHDRGVSSGWRGPIEWIPREHLEPPLRFVHDVSRPALHDAGSFSLSGHIHPVIALRGLRKKTSRVPVFWLRERDLVLPAFGSFTGGYRITPAPGEQVFAVGPDQVTAFPRR